MKSLWYYIRSQSSHQTTERDGSVEYTPKKTCGTKTRGSSIPENVLLGLLGRDMSNKDNKRQRYSAPSIIQKDKAEKAWERMMKLKSNEKKVKRKTSRLMLKNWSRQRNENQAVGSGTDSSTERVLYETNNGNSQYRPDFVALNNNSVNVVVIIDSVSPTKANGTSSTSNSNQNLASGACTPPYGDETELSANGQPESHCSSPSGHYHHDPYHNQFHHQSYLVKQDSTSGNYESVARCSGEFGCKMSMCSMSNQVNGDEAPSPHQHYRADSSIMGDRKDESVESRLDRITSEDADDEDDDAIDIGAGSYERSVLQRQSRNKPESCSSYSSLNNDECSASLHSQEGVFHQIDSRLLRNMPSRAPTNYPRKYSLTVPGEPRHMRTLHRRESGSRSPLNSSCGGLSPSELSTPSPSCSNSINDDQSSCSSGGLNAIPIEHSRKCALSVDSLFLKARAEKAIKAKQDKHRLDDLCKDFLGLRATTSSSASIKARELDHNELHSSKDNFGSKESTKVPKRRKDSMTAIIASLLLPDSLYQRLGGSASSDRLHQQSSSHTESASRSKSPRNFFSKSKSPISDSKDGEDKDTPGPSEGRRKGSIAQAISSASATRLARLLRRTHSAGCSKDVPSYALFLSGDKSARKQRRQAKERKRGRKQAPALEDMKQRLRFLRRRHTDSSLHSSTVRPSRDEVEKWSQSFRDLMANRYGCALFRAFLSREYSEENIEFWIACEEYRKTRSSKLRHKARKIFDNFVAIRAPREVNIDPQLRGEIEHCLALPNKSTFDEAQRKIQGLLESDSYVRFLKSDLYTDLVKSEQERKSHQEEDEDEDEELRHEQPGCSRDLPSTSGSCGS